MTLKVGRRGPRGPGELGPKGCNARKDWLFCTVVIIVCRERAACIVHPITSTESSVAWNNSIISDLSGLWCIQDGQAKVDRWWRPEPWCDRSLPATAQVQIIYGTISSSARQPMQSMHD